MHPTKAFTLIELLVVITIIVVLLALLTPALDKAVYQAQLAVCGSQLKTIASGSILYAAENKRHYPYRYSRSTGYGRPNLIRYGGQPPDWDDRPVFRGYLSLDTFVDPLTADISLDESDNSPETHILLSRAVFAGWRYAGNDGMLRLGDRFAYKENRFDILAADVDQIENSFQESHSSHPDEDQKMILITQQDQPAVSGLGILPGLSSTFSEWNWSERGVVDAYNYAASDASVFRLNRVDVRHGNAPGDERLKPANVGYNSEFTHNFYLPTAR